MNNWNPIFVDVDREIIWQKINEIANALMISRLPCDPYLLHGEMGRFLFLFHHCYELDDDACYEVISEKFTEEIDKIHKSALFVEDPSQSKVSFENGLSGVGWEIGYLFKQEMLEGAIFEVMGDVDPWVFRRMIYDVQEDKYGLLQGATGIALYCQSRQERFPKEYLTRFIRELDKGMNQGKLDAIQDFSIPSGLSGLYLLLRKVQLKYPDIAHVSGIVKRIERKLKQQTGVLQNTLNTQPGWSQQEVGILWSQLQIPESRDLALEQWAEYGNLHLKSGEERLESGLYGGNFSLGHLFNRIYQLSGENDFKNLATEFFYSGLGHANYIEKETGHKLWYTGINGIYGLHHGFLGGLAGIGLALLSTVSDKTPDWDEVILLS